MLSGNYYGNNFKWFVGVVKVVIDESRVRVRIFGIHHTEDVTNVSDEDLPPALVLLPTTGHVENHNLQPGMWVFGFFADGEDCQQPVVVGVAGNGLGSTNNSGVNSTYPTDGQIPGVEQQGWDSTTIDLNGNSNIEKSYNFLREKFEAAGRNEVAAHAAVSGIVGRMLLESNLNPSIRNSIGAFGICQWLGDRRTNLFRKYGSSPTLGQQLSFFWDELHGGGYNKARNLIMGATSVYESCYGMCWFEKGEEFQYRNGAWFVNTEHKNFKLSMSRALGVYNSISYQPRQDRTAAPNPRTGAVS